MKRTEVRLAQTAAQVQAEHGHRDQPAEIGALWQARADAPFPPRLRDSDVAGVDLVMLDAEVSGRYLSWQGSRAPANWPYRHQLKPLLRSLDEVLPALSDTEEIRYFSVLHQLVTSMHQASR